MKSLRFGGCALSAGIAAILLAGCGESSMPIRVTDSATTDAGALKNSKLKNSKRSVTPARSKRSSSPRASGNLA